EPACSADLDAWAAFGEALLADAEALFPGRTSRNHAWGRTGEGVLRRLHGLARRALALGGLSGGGVGG
ncbi:MAG: hypothetical protein LC721_03885, partial [Actinobacteria bacterium]|nr:hypothetical protein [Actinomycetota bacterium]